MAGIARFARPLMMACGIGCSFAVAGCQTEGRGSIIQAPARCESFTVSLYFAPNSAAVSGPAGAALGAATKRAGNCRLLGVKVMGLADAAGSSAVNLTLSDRRATAVAEALTRRGLSLSLIEVVGAGDAGARDRFGEARPERRRVDIAFRVAPSPAVH